MIIPLFSFVSGFSPILRGPILRRLTGPLRTRPEATSKTARLLGAAMMTAFLAACAAPAPEISTTRDAEVAETLRLAQEARLELQTQASRLAELEGQVRDLSEMLAWSAERDGTQDRTLDSIRRGTPLPKQRAQAPTPAVKPSDKKSDEWDRGRVSPDEATSYRKALDLYFARQYVEANEAFRDLLTQYPNGAYAGNARYWIGEGHYGLGEYAQALASFQSVLTTSGGSKTDDAQLKLGYCHLKLGDPRRAGEEFRKLVSLHPTSEYVERARGELTKLGQP